MPLRGFGGSDCRCATHLYWFDETPSAKAFEAGAGREKTAVALEACAT
jgi:Uri superfamily endonuclease